MTGINSKLSIFFTHCSKHVEYDIDSSFGFEKFLSCFTHVRMFISAHHVTILPVYNDIVSC